MALTDVTPRPWPSSSSTFAHATLRGCRRMAGMIATTSGLVLEQRFSAPTSADGYARRAQRTARALLAVHGVEVRAFGRAPSRPSIVVCNHVSYLDPLVVSSVVPCLSVAKGETRGWPLIGDGLEALGVVFVRRGDAYSGARALLRCVRALGEGASVLNFPEGTTSDGHHVGAFRRGVFGLARLLGVAVIPACLSYDDDRVAWFGGAAFTPHYLRLASMPRVVARMHFGAALEAGAAEDADAFASRTRAAVDALRHDADDER